MAEKIHAVQVGAPDPELQNSPIFEESDEEFEVAGQELENAPVCYFNDTAFNSGEFVCSGSELLRCYRGGWVRVGSCDPDNP